MEEQKPSLGSRMKSFFIQNKRVLRITRKPSREEFKITLKVSGLGTLVIGFIGFLIHILGIIITK